MATIEKILVKVKTYADKNGMTAQDVLNAVREHDNFPKAKRGRPRKDGVSSPEMERKHKRPKGAPPKDHSWDGDQGVYINSDGAPYQKEEKVASNRPRGAPPKDHSWDGDQGVYINSDGEVYQKEEKVASNRPKGRPPKGKVWDEEQGEYVDME